MAVLGRVLFSSAERVDLPDLLSLDSYAAGDWKYFLQSIVGTTKPYILSGFDVINPETSIGLPTCSIRVADSVVYYPGSAAGPFFYGLEEGNENAEPLVPSLRSNATNYVYLTLSTFNTASDTRALWDPDRNGGQGAEFTQDINTESVIKAEINVSTGSFPVNTIPVAIITMGSTAISSIQDARDMLFRLGSGGLNPDPLNTFGFRDVPSSSYARSEPNTTISSGSDPNPFQGGDKNIRTLKEWMDVVMTKLKELGGTKYWYEETDTFGLVTLFQDALATAWKSKGTYTHSSATPGELSWSEDLYVKSVNNPRDIVIRASGASPLQLEDEQVAFIDLVRNQPINTLDQPVAFTNGQAYINTIGGSVGLFQNLQKGDWIKKSTDADVLFLQVREFYNTTQSPGPVSGTPTTAANARSITLSAAYQGTTSQPSGDRARYDRGEYQPTDISIVDRDDASLTNAGGNIMWFALRSDTVLSLASASSTTLNGTVTFADGSAATCSCTSHGLIDGDRIYMQSPPGHVGIKTVEVIDANTFVIRSTDTATGAFVATFGLATTTSTSVDGFQLESANHGLDSGETVILAGTTNYNGAFVVSVRSSTQFQFAKSGNHATETTGTMRLARMDVRSEEGINKIVQGETIDVGSNTTDNIRAFIGMDSPDQTSPVYTLSAGYNTFNAGANYNGSLTDDLTGRVAKNTAMLMDKTQDKTIQFLTNAVEATNATNGVAQTIYFVPPSSTLTLVQPGSPGNATVSLPSSGGSIQLLTNQCAYVSINRNAASTPGVVVANITAVPVEENVFVLATRLADDTVYLWNGMAVGADQTTPIHLNDVPLVNVTFYDPVSTTLPTGNPVTMDNISVNAGDLVLFTNLSSNNNRVYKAVGLGTNISSWTALYKFHNSLTPTVGDMVVVKKGDAFGLQVGKYNGSAWVFNDKVRYFNGTDYWEQSNIVSATINDGASDTVFQIEWANNEHIIVDYSIVRGTIRETGSMRIVTDGADAVVSTDSSFLNGNTGVTFTAAISGSDLIVSYSATSTGDSATMKYMMRRWGSGAAGPTGIPSYSGAAPAPTAAAGGVNTIQFNSGGSLAGNVNFQIDTSDLSINMNGLRQGVLASTLSILDGDTSWTNTGLTFDGSSHPFYIVEYSLIRGGQARVGQFMVAYNGSASVALNDAYTETAATDVTFQAIMSGTDIVVQHQVVSGAGDAELKCSWRKWA